MKKKAVLLMLTVFLVFCAVQIASAAIGWSDEQGALPANKFKNSMNSLNLTDDQLSKMREFNQKHYQATRELRIKLQDTMFELRQLKLSKNPDQAKVDAKVKEVQELRSKLTEARQQHRAECQSILTEEQKAKISSNPGPCGNGPGCGQNGMGRNGFDKGLGW